MKKGRLKFSDDLFIVRYSFPYKIAVYSGLTFNQDGVTSP
ncbi:hypothetical protein NEISICOT_00222 [Neisseria sicca ATCC 29256]|uniref:Uncharacterized protein n=1 Tax=Neisseria sicca ATCC 29256 TaxID=547045 RepID=C6M143_NEISI|nr:hypothetical protein NEISICOT_00222 [Neisseria sicca ATCC 29256]